MRLQTSRASLQKIYAKEVHAVWAAVSEHFKGGDGSLRFGSVRVSFLCVSACVIFVTLQCIRLLTSLLGSVTL
jgi:hypothetical protein